LKSMSTAASVKTRTVGSAGFHLNRRGRFLFVGLPVLVLAVLAAAAAVFLGAHAVAPAAAAPERPVVAPVESVTVDYGDTLWSVAGQVAPDAPRNQTILRIGELNDLTGSELQPGQVLFVPRG
jgi:Tfp pilus assembly protein FimV